MCLVLEENSQINATMKMLIGLQQALEKFFPLQKIVIVELESSDEDDLDVFDDVVQKYKPLPPGTEPETLLFDEHRSPSKLLIVPNSATTISVEISKPAEKQSMLKTPKKKNIPSISTIVTKSLNLTPAAAYAGRAVNRDLRQTYSINYKESLSKKAKINPTEEAEKLEKIKSKIYNKNNVENNSKSSNINDKININNGEKEPVSIKNNGGNVELGKAKVSKRTSRRNFDFSFVEIQHVIEIGNNEENGMKRKLRPRTKSMYDNRSVTIPKYNVDDDSKSSSSEEKKNTGSEKNMQKIPISKTKRPIRKGREQVKLPEETGTENKSVNEDPDENLLVLLPLMPENPDKRKVGRPPKKQRRNSFN